MESPNCWGWKGLLRIIQSNAAAKAGSPGADCTESHPGMFWVFPDRETPQPPWASCSSVLSSPPPHAGWCLAGFIDDFNLLSGTLWSEQMGTQYLSPFLGWTFLLCPYSPTWPQLFHSKYPHHTVQALRGLLSPCVLVWRDLFWPWLEWPANADPGSPAS